VSRPQQSLAEPLTSSKVVFVLTLVGNAASVENWMKTINAKATTPEGRLYTAQLGSVMTYYNKAPQTGDNLEVNWEDWSKRINTKGLVEKIKQNSEALLKEKYNVVSTAEKITGQPSEEYKKIVYSMSNIVKRASLPFHSLECLLQGNTRESCSAGHHWQSDRLHCSRPL